MSNEDPWEWAKIAANEIGLEWDDAEGIMFSMDPRIFGIALQWVKENRDQEFHEMPLDTAYFCFMQGTARTLYDFRKSGFKYPENLEDSNGTAFNFFQDISSILNFIKISRR